MSDLTNFQSLLQLSVALNVTFTIVISIFGNSVSREKLIIQNLLSQAKDVRDQALQGANDAEIHRQSLDLWKKCYQLRQQIERSIDKVDRLAFDRFRPVALVGAAICFVFLVLTSYPNATFISSPIGIWLTEVIKFTALLSLLPFLGFVMWSAYYSATKSRAARNERVKLDEELTSLLDKLNPTTAT